MKTSDLVCIVCAATLASGCLRTVSGPVRARVTASAAVPGQLRVVYAGRRLGQPDDFVARLEAGLGRELGRPIPLGLTTWRFSGGAQRRPLQGRLEGALPPARLQPRFEHGHSVPAPEWLSVDEEER